MFAWIRRREVTLGLPIRLFLCFNLACCLLLSFQHIGYHQADEHFQINEFAWYLLGEGPAEDLPWEFGERMRPTLQPVVAAAYFQVMGWLGFSSPYLMNWIIRIAMSLVSLASMLLMIRLFECELKSISARRILWGASILFWFLPYLLIRFTAENTSGIAFVLALYVLYDRKEEVSRTLSWGKVVGAGALLGLCFVLRYQMAFALAGLGLWMLVFRALSFGRISLMVSTAFAIFGLSILLDSWFYGEWTVAPYQYYVANIVEKKAASFGVHPWYQYFIELFIWMGPPLSIVLVFLLFFGLYKRPKHLLTWCFMPFFLAHVAVGHKEMRFLFPMLYILPLFVAIAVENLPSRLRWPSFGRGMVRLNMILLAIMLYRPVYTVVDFNEYYQKFVYDYSLKQKQPIRIASFNESPYAIFDLEMNFYKPDGVELMVIDSVYELENLLRKANQDHQLLLNIRGFDGPPAIEGVKWELMYGSFHPHFEHYNYVNWQSMVKMRYLYKPVFIEPNAQQTTERLGGH